MTHYMILDELLFLTKHHTKGHICWWLFKYEGVFKKAINNSECAKWRKWYFNNEKPYPCVCPKREEECLFIDIYKNLRDLADNEEFDKILIRDYFNQKHTEYEQHLP